MIAQLARGSSRLPADRTLAKDSVEANQTFGSLGETQRLPRADRAWLFYLQALSFSTEGRWPMLGWLRTRQRVKMALAVAGFYVLSVLTPAAALTLGDISLHCFNELHGLASSSNHAGTAHAHKDGAVHHHMLAKDAAPSKGDHGKAQDHKCCGLFPVSALAHRAETSPEHVLSYSFDFPTLEAKLSGRSADRLDRPPNV